MTIEQCKYGEMNKINNKTYRRDNINQNNNGLLDIYRTNKFFVMPLFYYILLC